MAELADARDSKSRPGNRVRVQVPPSVLGFSYQKPIFLPLLDFQLDFQLDVVYNLTMFIPMSDGE